MRLPFSVDGRDVIVELADGDVTVGEAVEAINGVASAKPASIGGRSIVTTTALVDAGVRPGDDLAVTGTIPTPLDATGWAVHIIGGIDAGRVVAIPPPRPIEASTAPTGLWSRIRRSRDQSRRQGRREVDDGPTMAPSIVTVGRDPSMTVRLASAAVSKHHCTISIDGPVIAVVDQGSRNGTIAAGRRVGSNPIVVEVGDMIHCGPTVLTVRAVPVADTPASVSIALSSPTSGTVPFHRSPVDLPADPGGEVALPAGPRRPRTGRPGLIGFLLPLVMAAGLVYFTGQLLYALFALMGPVMMLVTTLDRASRNRSSRKRSRRRYRSELAEFREELDEAVGDEVRRRRSISPDLAELARRARVASALLWSRRRDHPHFLELSLGLADVPWHPPVGTVPDDAPELEQLVGAAAVLPSSPLTIVAQPGTTIGLAGDRAAALATARALLIQIATLHGPAEVRVVLVTGANGVSDWEWAKWLPHLRPTFAEGRLLAVSADVDGRVDAAALDDILADIDGGAALVAIVDTHGLADAGDIAIRRLLRRSESTATGIVLASTADGLPDQSDVVVEHHVSAGEATCRWPREGGRSLDIVTNGMAITVAESAARSLARLSDPDAGGGSASLPARVGLADVLGLDNAPASRVTQRWQRSGPLTVPVGLGETGPVNVDLVADGPHLVVIGGRGAGKTEHLSAIVLALAAAQPPDRVHIVLWGESFGHLHRLPHVASTASRIEEGVLNKVMEGLDRELTRRERLRTQRNVETSSGIGGSPTDGEPRLVIVIDDIDTITRVLPKATDDLVRLLRRSRGLGVHILWSAGRASGGVMNDYVDLSSIRIVLRVASPSESNDLLGSDVAARLERSLPGRGFVVAGRNEPREVQGGAVSIGAPRPSGRLEVAPFTLGGGRQRDSTVVLGPPDERALVSLLASAGAGFTRPTDLLSEVDSVVAALQSPGLLELLGLDEPGALARITETWHTIDGDGYLRVPIGVDPEMRPVQLDLKESAQGGMGPHGLLVGATGAGKSELLRTLVAGLAVTHSPEALAFVLVDFKGGASFADLGRLPHVAGVVTNLADDLALVDRILAALGGEQRRRQELLSAAGNLGSAHEYRAARRDGRLPPELADLALPELVVVVDEFAELLDQEPAFIDFFLTIGRVGRSLGIHLLLASQRLEEGKLRGLDTYLSYRLGLRTFSAAESRIVLGVPDAYSLPTAPGGGYLKVGSTSFERFQASYVSGPAPAPDTSPDTAAPSDREAGEIVGRRQRVLDLIIDTVADAADRVHQIWLPPLAPAMPLDVVFPQGFVHDLTRGFAAVGWRGTGLLSVPAGVLDEPELQRQLPLIIDFAGSHANLAIAGAPQAGKSVFLRTALLSLAVTHTPDEVQVYGVDYGGGALEALADLPHVGAIASRLEPERVRRVIAMIEGVLAQREALFRERGIDSVATFRSLRMRGELPPDAGGDVFLVIDGWAAFREHFEPLEPVIADLASRGLGYGVHVVVTLNRWMEMRPAVLDAIGGRLELRLNSAADSTIDRRRAAVIRVDQAGRGLHQSARLFQIALPRLDGESNTDQLAAATRVAVEHIAGRWNGAGAAPVRLLPTQVHVSDLIDPEALGTPPGVPVGLLERGMEPWFFDLIGSEPHCFVFGDGESGKTTFLRTWLTGLAERTSPERSQVVLVDYRRTLLEAVPAAHLRAYAASEPAAREVIEAVAAEAQSRLPGADVTASQLRDRSWWSGPELYVVVDDYDLVLTPMSNPLVPLLPLLAQGRDIGLHVVISRRVAGAAKAMYEPITARIREVSPAGLILSGDRDEGPLIGPVRAGDQPPGRGILVARRRPPALVQVAVTD